MRTIPADTAAKWINYTIGIEAALTAVERLGLTVPHEIWQQVWGAKVNAKMIRDQLMIFAVQDVAVEAIEPVRVVKIVPGAPVDVVPAFIMAAE